jgi:galactokinase/mevalonate kinase-like predicted kinase
MHKDISVITINYNHLEGLKNTFKSIVNQTDKQSIEWIVIDGNSTDGSADFLREHQNNIDVLEIAKDKGIYDAMNKGIALATGEDATRSPLATGLTALGSSGLLTSGINTAIDAFSANQLDPSRPMGQRAYEGPPSDALLAKGVNNQFSAAPGGLNEPLSYSLPTPVRF